MEKKPLWFSVQRWRAGRSVNQDALPASLIDETPQDQEIVLFEQPAECLDTRAFDQEDWFDVHARNPYNPSISQEQLDADPAEDYKPDPSRPSRLGPSS
jgi:hypothetical protein